jgi:hypothetical protein
MKKATSTFLAAAAALALSGGVYAQTAGGSGDSSNPGAMPGPATTQMNNNGTSGYGMPGVTNSDAGSGSLAPPNSPQQQSTNTAPAHTSGPKSNNSLATPSVLSPADQH